MLNYVEVGSAKYVTAAGGGKKKRGPTTMAMVLTGRILMCHLFTLAVVILSSTYVVLPYLLPTSQVNWYLNFERLSFVW